MEYKKTYTFYLNEEDYKQWPNVMKKLRALALLENKTVSEVIFNLMKKEASQADMYKNFAEKRNTK